jgi:Flp pilus assembly protein TadD
MVACVPPSVESPPADVKVYANTEECDDLPPCNVILSFADTGFQGHDWRNAIDNYNDLFKCGCKEIKESPEKIYKYMGYSYRQLGLNDSAAYTFDQGLKYIQEDIELLKYAGENAGKLNKIEKQIYYYDKILSIEENTPEVLEILSNIYGNQGMFEEQIDVLNIWLKYEPSSKNANSDKRSAYEALGKDISSVDKERWEAEASNIDYGLEYIHSLEKEDNTEKIIEVCNELLVYEKHNRKVLRYLGDAYRTLYKNEDAINVYKALAKADRTDYDVAIEISTILIEQENYPEALNWAEQAVSISNKEGISLYQRAEVYFEIATNCNANENEMSHWTRAVYEFAWQDYRDALNSGYKQARNRKIWLEEQELITQIGTWFQLEPKTEIILSASPIDCYAWINRILKKRKI